MQNRRDFLKTTSLALAGSALMGCSGGPQRFHVGKGGSGRMQLRYFPYELELTHTSPWLPTAGKPRRTCR